MFTVKHTSADYVDTIYSAKTVEFHPVGDLYPEERVTLIGGDYEPNGSVMNLLGGVVYVMNSSGSTVAKYDLNVPRGILGISASQQALQMQTAMQEFAKAGQIGGITQDRFPAK